MNSLKNITTDLSEQSTETWFVEQTWLLTQDYLRIHVKVSFRASVFSPFYWNKVVANRKHDISTGKKEAFPKQIGDGKDVNMRENYCLYF